MAESRHMLHPDVEVEQGVRVEDRAAQVIADAASRIAGKGPAGLGAKGDLVIDIIEATDLQRKHGDADQRMSVLVRILTVDHTSCDYELFRYETKVTHQTGPVYEVNHHGDLHVDVARPVRLFVRFKVIKHRVLRYNKNKGQGIFELTEFDVSKPLKVTANMPLTHKLLESEQDHVVGHLKVRFSWKPSPPRSEAALWTPYEAPDDHEHAKEVSGPSAAASE